MGLIKTRSEKNKLLRNKFGTPSVAKAIHLRDEAKKLHLIDSMGNRNALVNLRCSKCRTLHPDNPSALEWFKIQFRKGLMKCRCGCRNFLQTDRQTPQGELIADLIAKKSNLIRRVIGDEVGDESEGKNYERKFGVKIV